MANLAVGFGGAFLAVVFFGTYGIFFKLAPTGDGMVFQWIQCCAIFFVGIIIEVSVGNPYYFEPLGMLGGVFWCLGNATVTPIVDSIGLGIGILIWGISSMITGWASGNFGIFVDKETVTYPVLNYIGVVLAIISTLLYLPVKPTLRKQTGNR